jgi:hypothetical protein
VLRHHDASADHADRAGHDYRHGTDVAMVAIQCLWKDEGANGTDDHGMMPAAGHRARPLGEGDDPEIGGRC